MACGERGGEEGVLEGWGREGGWDRWEGWEAVGKGVGMGCLVRREVEGGRRAEGKG